MNKVVVFLFCVWLAGCGQKASNAVTPDTAVTAAKLVGRWEYLKPGASLSTHYYYDFKADNTVTLVYDAAQNKTDGTWPFVIEGNILRIVRAGAPKERGCETFFLPDQFSTQLRCKEIGLGYCITNYKGDEAFTYIYFVKQ